MGDVMRAAWAHGACVLAVLWWCLPAFAEVRVGDTPPDYVGIDQRKEHIRISDYRGRVVVTTFWASWCGPCMNEMPMLEKFQKAAGRDRMVVVGINMNEPFQRYRMIMSMLQTSPLSLVHDDGRLARKFGVTGIPHLFMIDKTGKVAQIHKGYTEAALPGFLDEINALLTAPYEPEATDEPAADRSSSSASSPPPAPAGTAASQH
jgi:thiol-disulfide isomerase/thioredoxin